MARKVPKTLYHYCSLQTFYSIIKNRSIWISDVGKSNDSLELKWIKGQCKYYILKVWAEYLNSVVEIGGTDKLDLEAFEDFKKLQNQLDDLYAFETEKCWAFCLSEKQDDLGQWRGYADDGFGIAIGFKSSYFKKIGKNETKELDASSSVAFDSIAYKDKEVEKLFYEICGLSSITPQMNSKAVLQKLRGAIVASLLLAPFYKNKKFAEEKEWRLVFSLLTKSLNEGKTPKTEFEELFPENEIEYDFVVRNNEMVSHIEFSDKNLARYISEIWMGPKCKLSSNDLKLFLVSAGVLQDFSDDSIRIHKSQASYR